VKIGFVAGSPWNITAASFAIFWSVIYPLLCVPDGFWENLTDKLDRFWNAAEYARIEREEAQLNAEREARLREQNTIKQQEAFEKRAADRKREAEDAERWDADRKRREAVRLKREAYEKSLAEEKERKRKAAVIHDLKSDDHDGIPDF
jgi:signal transduction histidine kinase